MAKQTIPKDISYNAFITWRTRQKEQGKKHAMNALRHNAQAYNSYILANPVNETSFAHFLRSDIQSKTFSVQARTERTGILDGFIAMQEGIDTRPLIFIYEGESYTAIERNGKQLLTLNPSPHDTIIHASCYSDGSFIVSDIDLLFIISKKAVSSEIILDPTFGELTSDEKEMIEEINSTFSPNFKLITHGPANRFSKSKASHIHFPITIATPKGDIISLGKEEEKISSLNALFSFLSSIEELGYQYTLNPRWLFNV